MSKIKLAVAFALAACAAASQADVTIYGIAQASVDVGNNGGNTVGTHAFYQDIGARLGFKGEDKLDNGSKLQWNVYQYTGGYAWGTREAWIGISDNTWGSFRSGKSKGAYDQLEGEFDTFESNTVLYNTFNDAYFTGFPTNAIFYTSPDLGGLVLNGEYQFKDGANANAYSYALYAKYTQEKFALFGIYQAFGNTGRNISDPVNGWGRSAANGKSLSSAALGVQVYPVEGMILGALYQHAEQDLVNTLTTTDASGNKTSTVVGDPRGQMKRDSVLLQAQYSTAHWTPRVGYVHQFEGKFDNNAPKLKAADQFEIGTDYNMSKHSILYTEFSYIKNRGENGFQSSAGSDGWTVNNTGDSKVLSVGLISLF